jgi:hypothetical protein
MGFGDAVTAWWTGDPCHREQRDIERAWVRVMASTDPAVHKDIRNMEMSALYDAHRRCVDAHAAPATGATE